MWWNFVGRTHDDIVEARRDWQEQSDRFGKVAGYEGERAWLPAPELPPVMFRVVAPSSRSHGYLLNR